MTEPELRMIELLSRIEDNQRQALALQQEHLQIAQRQLERSNRSVEESIELQRVAVSRQAQVTRFVLPLIVLLVFLLVYLVVKWRIL
ncbi:hypothetical protein [Ramlibacter rhizophilus]|uniref:Uncharacterized protein n=1 Tax=Ramlibacter rhizophilus TaxID=1781167 RepID=A0A4Z0BGI3_9BURK|nr:hypothetical protein [Ramlibacter rhizophilus]TFY98436.1 hypothetical protein EZ242_12870 [Ramlibacter rhizophilus]